MATCIIRDRKELAGILTNMPYNELLKVADEFVEMVKDADRQIDNAHGMADMLADWADAQDDQ